MRIQMLATTVLAALAMQATAAVDEGSKIEAKSPSGKGGYRIQPSLVIGGADAADEAQFFEKLGRTDVDADANGNIYVLDTGGPRVQVFDAAGKFLRGFGKKGEGPGEMKIPGLIAVSADGHVAIFDMGLGRVSIFDPQGRLVRDQLMQGVVRDMVWDARGRLVCADSGDGYQALELDGKVAWTLEPKDGGRPAGGRRFLMEIGNETVAPRLAAIPGGDVFCASREEYGIRRLSQGTVLATWRRDYDRQARRPLPTRRDAAEGDGGNQVVIVRRSEGGGSAAAGTQTSIHTGADASQTLSLDMDDLQKMMPKFSPDIRGLLAWADGRLWVVTSTDDGDTMIADEWTPRGEYSKRFTVPARYSRLRVGADGKLYGVTHDKDEYVIVQRLDAAPIVP
jgi:YD repeat-containing protein